MVFWRRECSSRKGIIEMTVTGIPICPNLSITSLNFIPDLKSQFNGQVYIIWSWARPWTLCPECRFYSKPWLKSQKSYCRAWDSGITTLDEDFEVFNINCFDQGEREIKGDICKIKSLHIEKEESTANWWWLLTASGLKMSHVCNIRGRRIHCGTSLQSIHTLVPVQISNMLFCWHWHKVWLK